MYERTEAQRSKLPRLTQLIKGLVTLGAQVFLILKPVLLTVAFNKCPFN